MAGAYPGQDANAFRTSFATRGASDGGAITRPSGSRSCRRAARQPLPQGRQGPSSAGQLQDCWVQLTPLGVQMPQLGLQQNVPGAQIVPPHDTASGASASVAGTGSSCGAAGAGHSGHSRAQSGLPVQPVHNRSGG